MGAQVSQNILNLVDTYMVGKLGDAALAAVGLGGFASFMSFALLMGVSTGVQATSSRRKGEGNIEEMANPLNTGLAMVFTLGVPLMAILYFAIPHLYPFLNPDPEVVKLGSDYLQIRILALVAITINFCFRGYWNAIDNAKFYMGTLVFAHSTNVVLNYLLIFGNFGFPALGVRGAALGTTISLSLGSLIYFFLGLKYARANGFLSRFPSVQEIWAMFKLSLPAGIQQFFFSAGFTAFYWIIGQVGTSELAAANVMVNIILLAILPGLGLGMTAATLVGQALGRREPEDASIWGWDVTKVGSLMISVIVIPMWAFPEIILSAFLKDPDTLALAITPMRLTGLGITFDCAGLILMGALQGAGDTRTTMKISVLLQWVVFLPFAYILGPVLGHGLLTLWGCYLTYRLIQAGLFARLWIQGKWQQIEV